MCSSALLVIVCLRLFARLLERMTVCSFVCLFGCCIVRLRVCACVRLFCLFVFVVHLIIFGVGLFCGGGVLVSCCFVGLLCGCVAALLCVCLLACSCGCSIVIWSVWFDCSGVVLLCSCFVVL